MGNRLTGPASPKPLNYSQDYTYDYENRLTRVVKHSGQNTDTITFKYDPFGRRIEKNVETTENSIPTTYKYTYVYDNEDIILEVLDKTQNAVTTTTTTSYVHGPGIDEPLSLERNSQKYYYHADGLGSITSMTDSTQAVVNRYSYDSFGNVQRAETVWNDFTYTGREYDYETGQYYLRARYYDPETGRFVSKDPIGFGGGDVNVYGYTDSVGKPLPDVNAYHYTYNNPVNSTDSQGLSPDRDCSYYDTLCKEYGGKYYCSYAPKICKKFPDIGNWSNCVAECLQNFEQKYGCGNECNNDKSPGWTDICTKDAHAFCWTSCASGNPNNPPFPVPPYQGPQRSK